MAVFLWVYGLMSPLSGIVGDRMSRKWLIVGSLCVWSGVTYLMGYATTFNHSTGCVELWELVKRCIYLLLCHWIADFHKDKTRSLAVGNTYDRVVCGTGYRWIWSYFCSNLFLAYNIHWFGIIGVGYGVILAFLLRDKERGSVSENQKMKKIPVLKSLGMLFSNVFFWIILFYFCVPGTPGWAAKNWLPTLFSGQLIY